MLPTPLDAAGASQATIPAGTAGDPFVRVSTLLAGLRRRWLVWTATALVGLVLGGAFYLAKPPQWSATTTLVLQRPTTTAADPARQMETDVQLAQSLAVQDGAHLAAGTMSGYIVSSLSNDVLQITTQATTASAAVRSATELARAFLSYRSQQMSHEAQVVGTVFSAQIDALTAKVAAVNSQIDAAAAAARTTAAAGQSGLGDLLTSRAQLNGQLSTIQQRISDASVSASVAAQNSRTLDPAYPTPPSKFRTLGIDLAAGLIGGAVIGAGWVIFVAATTERLWRREDVMAAVGAPVAMSVGSAVDRHRFNGLKGVNSAHLRRRPRRPGRDDRLMIRHLRRALAASTTAKPALLVVSVDSDWAAAQVVAATAAELRSDGNDVLMADFSRDAALARRLRTTAPVTTVEAGPPASKLWLGANPPTGQAPLDDWLPLNDLGAQADVVLVLATLDPAVGAGHLVGLASTAVVVVTAGRPTATALRSTGRMVRAEGIHLHSVILLGADRNDETCGARPGTASSMAGPLALQDNR